MCAAVMQPGGGLGMGHAVLRKVIRLLANSIIFRTRTVRRMKGSVLILVRVSKPEKPNPDGIEAQVKSEPNRIQSFPIELNAIIANESESKSEWNHFESIFATSESSLYLQ